MSIATISKKELSALPQKVARLEREVRSLRDVIINISLAKDPEGEYKPEFVKRVLAAAKNDAGPFYIFKGKESFRKLLRSVK